jgi:hypothetical protein
MAEHMDVNTEPNPGFSASSLDHPSDALTLKGIAALVHEHISRLAG